MRKCFDSHPSCRSHRRPFTSLPKRLLNISTASEGYVRLWEPQNDTLEAYACLSYCWGERKFLQTTKSNAAAHLEHIPIADLPRVFRDAVSVTQRLGLRYLWIDSLCIVQDDEDEWRQTATQMASIYQGSQVVISATSAPDVHSGLHGKPDLIHRSTEVMDKHCGDFGTSIYCRRLATHLPGLLDTGTRGENSLPALSRGWIFQERLLAPRTVHFGPEEISWECLETSTCQCVQDEDRPSRDNVTWLDAGSLGSFSMSKEIVNPQSMSDWNPQTIIRCWHRIVEEYSKLELSYEFDILPALSGLAALFEPYQASPYLAGLWEGSLFQDLLWHHERPHDDPPAMTFRSSQWRAPSWSWASLKCPVKFIDVAAGLSPLCSLCEASCEPVTGSGSLGQLATGYLLLRGKLISLTLHHSIRENSDKRLWHVDSLESTRDRMYNIWIDDETMRLGPSLSGRGTEVHCLPVGIKSASGALECLLLTRSSKMDSRGDRNGHAYHRIGLLELPKNPRADLSSWTNSMDIQDVCIL